MKTVITLIMLAPIFCFSQKLADGLNFEVDEFTKDTLLSTDWFTYNKPTWKTGNITYVRLVADNNITALGFKVVTGEVASISETDKLYLMFDDESILELQNAEYQITDFGAGSINILGSGAMGFNLLFILDEEQMNKICSNEIMKYRLDTSDFKIVVEPEKKKYTKEILRIFSSFKRIRDSLYN